MRVIVAARLSQLAEGQTGLDAHEQETVKWATQVKGWEVVGIAADHKSGKIHLWERPKLKPWVTEPELIAQYDAIVALKVDRLARADDEGISALKQWAKDNGKEIWISSGEVHFPSEGVDTLLWDSYIRVAQQEWLEVRERYMRMQNAKHELGSVIGTPPWGYAIVKDPETGIKYLDPTAEGRIWVPRIFGWIAEGWSAPEVGIELERKGISSGSKDGKWSPQRIAAMVKRSTYSGFRPREGMDALPVEPLVSRALQDKAIATFTGRARLGGTGPKLPKVLLAKLKCGHPDCPGAGSWPMYRVKGKYYRCTGPREESSKSRGCGAPMLLIVELDSLVLNFAEHWDSNEYSTQRFVGGNDASIRLEQVREEMAEALRTAPADRMTEIVSGYTAKIKALEEEGSMPPHWEEVKTGESEGQHLRSLDLDGQRAYLARKDIKAWADPEMGLCAKVDGALTRRGGPSAIATPHPEEEIEEDDE